jgi:hypothetical protein
MFQQCERIRSVMNQMIEQNTVTNRRHQHNSTTSPPPQDYLKSSLEPLKKTVSDLENSFESSRGLAVTLDSRLDACRTVMYTDILSSLEPYIDLTDEIYSTLDFHLLGSVNDTIAAINKSIRYRPGETKLQQEAIVDTMRSGSGEGAINTFSAEYVHNLRNQSQALVSYLKEFNEAAMIKCPGLHLPSSLSSAGSRQQEEMSSVEVKSLEEVMEDCFLLYKGNYSSLCDIISTTLVVEDLEVLREFLAIIATNDGEKKRVNLPSESRLLHPLRPFSW